MKRASRVARLLAFLIDLFFLAAVSLALLIFGALGVFLGAGSKASASDLLSALTIFAFTFFFFEIFLFLFYFSYLTAGDESTLGKGVFGLKVVRKADEAPCGIARALARTVAYCLSAFPLFLGFLIILLPGSRALHDIVAGTKVAVKKPTEAGTPDEPQESGGAEPQ